MSADLVTWLRAQLDDDERVARDATPGPWVREWAFHTHFVTPDSAATTAGGNVSRLKPSQKADAEHIARHDPARVLREVEAKRLRLGEIERELADDPDNDTVGWLLRVEALPYADQPGYQEAWRPE